jgi:hypothetical protein
MEFANPFIADTLCSPDPTAAACRRVLRLARKEKSVEEGLGYTEAASSLLRGKMMQGFDSALRSLTLLQRSKTVRRMVGVAITGIQVGPIPPYLGEGHRAILVSNYPSVPQTLRAVLKIVCRLPGERSRLKGIGRPEVVTQANPLLKALGIEKLVFQVHKDENGAYRLHGAAVKEVLAYLDGPGHVLWSSMTGRTRGNGLLEGDLRTGAALFSVKKGVPLVPMALVTVGEKAKLRVVRVRFGDPIDPPLLGEIGDFEKADFLVDLSKLALCELAKLLPPGQRGDFENVDEKVAETVRRLTMYQQ